MGAFARLQLALLDVDDKTADLIFAAFEPAAATAAAGRRPLSARRMKKAMKLALALLDSDGDSNSVSRTKAGKTDARQRPHKPGQSVKR
jgi:hypothetical protein